jgi:hypothetical protein
MSAVESAEKKHKVDYYLMAYDDGFHTSFNVHCDSLNKTFEYELSHGSEGVCVYENEYSGDDVGSFVACKHWHHVGTAEVDRLGLRQIATMFPISHYRFWTRNCRTFVDHMMNNVGLARKCVDFGYSAGSGSWLDNVKTVLTNPFQVAKKVGTKLAVRRGE